MTTTSLPNLSIRALSRITSLDRDYLIKRIGDAKPAGKRAGHPVYALAEVLPLLCRPAAAIAGEIDPDSLTPMDRRAWFDSEIKRRQLQVRDGELIPSADVELCLSTAFAAVAQSIRSIPDNLERRLGCGAEVSQAVEQILDEEMVALADRLSVLAPGMAPGA